MRVKQKLVYGYGVNDVDYAVQLYDYIENKLVCTWICPYYLKWKEMLCRCFSRRKHNVHPNYKGCTIDTEWKYLSNFIKWVDSQPNGDWVNCEPDKDMLILDNKHYGRDTVVFVNHALNSFIKENRRSRGKHYIGVDYVKQSCKFRSRCQNPFTGISSHMGYFLNELEAHKAWQAKKHEYACLLAEQQQDPRVAKVLKERYAPDKDWTNR